MKRFKARKTYLVFMLVLSVFLITASSDVFARAFGFGHWQPTRPITPTPGPAPETTAPTVTFTDPVNVATGVLINKKIAATFSEAMDPATITTTTFTLTRGGTVVSGTVAYSGVTAVFTPAANLASSTIYTATITTGSEDLAGNALANNRVWTFTTGAAADTTRPTVTLTDPVNAATGVAINKKIAATFSEVMDPLTITRTTFTLTRGGTAVSGTVAYSGVTAVFTPAANLASSTTYTATITTGAKDLAGNALASNRVWTFTTGAAADTTRPTVTSTDPANTATGVLINKKIAATFSELMDPLTITTLTFTLAQGGTAVSGTVAYSGVTAVFTPDSNLASSTTYTATITTGAKDLAGNALASNRVWTFTTGAAPDTTRPTVTLTVPDDGDTGVALNIEPTASFSEAMDPLTITTLTFTLEQGGAPVSGSVAYAGLIATFSPDSDLAAETTYIATITTGARDLAGNALFEEYVWGFTTGVAPDTTPPTVTLLNPDDGDTDVCPNKTIAATFSEAMKPLTITNVNFTVAAGGVDVIGTVFYDIVTNIATFTPDDDLDLSTTYTATITTAVQDLAGNALAADEVWSFTTGLTTCTTPIALGAAEPFGGFGGGAGMTNQGTLTVIEGDIGTTGASTLITGFHDSTGDEYTQTPLNIGTVNGRIYTAPPPPVVFDIPGGGPFGGTAATFAIATAAAADALDAWNNMSPALLPGGADVGNNLGGLTLFPGIYLAPPPGTGTFLLTGGDLTLDGQGDPNAVWVFQAPASLTVGTLAIPVSVILQNGAKAKNVFWYVGSAARIENRSSMVGTIIAQDGVTISTAGELATTTLEGRAFGLDASVTVVNTLINKPAP